MLRPKLFTQLSEPCEITNDVLNSYNNSGIMDCKMVTNDSCSVTFNNENTKMIDKPKFIIKQKPVVGTEHYSVSYSQSSIQVYYYYNLFQLFYHFLIVLNFLVRFIGKF